MSAMFPSYGNARRCQRCGKPLAPDEMNCTTCGAYNPLVPMNGPTERAQPPYNAPWGGTGPQTSYGADPFGGQSWGQPSMPSPPPNQFGPNTAPPQPVYSGAPFGTYGAPGPYNASQQPLYSAYAPAPATGPQQGYMNGYRTAGFQPPQPKRGPNVALLVGAVILLVLLVGGGVGYWYVSSHAGKAGNAVSTATTAIPTPSTPALFTDTFQNNKAGWDLTSVPGKYSVKVGGGSMVLEDDDNKLLWELLPGTQVYSDFKLIVDATLSKGDQNNGYGIYIRGASNQNSALATYYRFELYGDGTYGIFKGTVDANGNSQSQKLVGYPQEAAIQKQGGLNHILIIANGPSMTFVVNGATLDTITDNSYTNGSIALFVSNLPAPTPPGAQATFSNLGVYKL